MTNKVSLFNLAKFAGKGISKVVTNRVLAVSFEVTLSCNCNCHHCDLGGIRKGENLMRPKDYTKIVQDINPLFVQVSGGEPLLRKDILEIVKAIKQNNKLPYIILVSNGKLLNEEKYLKLREAGVDQFSISLDFPDERHDDFRCQPGLFKHLEKTIPQLARYNFNDIILNTAITRANFKEIIPLAKKAKDWGILISYSAYTSLRTGNKEYSFQEEKNLYELRNEIRNLIRFKKQLKCIVTPESIFEEMLIFFEMGYVSNCKAGIKFVVVMPGGEFVPCSMKRCKFSNLKDLQEKFVPKNQCGECYVSMRSNNEQNIFRQLGQFPQYIRLIGNCFR